jgi:nucleoside-diphosphate-sugar epimerase
MINAMTYSALTDKIINVNNGSTVRSILGLKDLCRAVETILYSESNPGIYNLSSFTTTAIEVAKEVSDITGASINDMGDTLTHKYNFDMDTTKFCETFNFEFKETAMTITQDLTDKFKEYDKSNRSESIHYT